MHVISKVLSAVHKDQFMNELTAQINFLGNNLDIYTESQWHTLLANIQRSLHSLETTENSFQFAGKQAAASGKKTSLNQILIN